MLQAKCLQLIYGVAGPFSQNPNHPMSRFTNSQGFASKLLHSSKMPAFTLYGSRGSTNTDRVRLTLAEGGFTDYELVLLNLQKGEQKVGDPVLSENRCGLSLYELIVYRIEPQNCLLIFPCLQQMILLRPNVIVPSQKSTRYVTHGVKYP